MEKIIFETEKFKIQKSKKNGWWIAIHKKANLCIEFENKKFNETQRIITMEDFEAKEFMLIARYIRELSDWIVLNHKDKI